MSIDRERCLKILKELKKRDEECITSWICFDQAREDGIIPQEWSHAQTLRALKYGVETGRFAVNWVGVGMTPWSGSAKRQRLWWITSEKERQEILEIKAARREIKTDKDSWEDRQRHLLRGQDSIPKGE